MPEENSDVIVVGSGVLGSSIATVMARDGRRVTVIERDFSEPDRIVGELLQPGGCRALEKLGLIKCLDGIDPHTIKGYVIHDTFKKTSVHIPYSTEGDGILYGEAFHHGRFIMKLREAAMAEENTTYLEGTVSQLLEEDGVVVGVEYKEKATGEPKEVRAPLTIVADGCFSKFRKDLVRQKPTVHSHFAGVVMRDCPQIQANHAELVLLDPSPILIYQISSRDTRILIDLKNGVPANLDDYMRNTIAPQMPDHIRPPFLAALDVDRPRVMPNGVLPPLPIIRPGVLLMGDALNMRHPLTGGGMSVVFNDVVIFRELFAAVDLRDSQAVMEAASQMYARRKREQSFVVNVMSVALYELFAATDDQLRRLKDACIAYFQRGGDCVSGPVGLLSILNPSPRVFFSHFAAVALYAVYFTFKSEPWWAIHRSVYSSAGILLKAGGILAPLVWGEMKSVVSR